MEFGTTCLSASSLQSGASGELGQQEKLGICFGSCVRVEELGGVHQGVLSVFLGRNEYSLYSVINHSLGGHPKGVGFQTGYCKSEGPISELEFAPGLRHSSQTPRSERAEPEAAPKPSINASMHQLLLMQMATQASELQRSPSCIVS